MKSLGSQDDLLIYHFSRIMDVDDKILSDALFRVDNKNISLALLGSGESRKIKVLKNVSKKRATIIQDDIGFYEMTHNRSECDEAQEKIVNAINNTILGVPAKNKFNDKMRRIRDYRNSFLPGTYTPDSHSHKKSGLDHKQTKSGRNWVRWILWLILILVIIFALIIWDKRSESIWDNASKAGWPSHRSSTPK